MRAEPYYAHSVEGHGPPHWQPLEDHLRQVGALAGDFAAAFGSAAWGELAGLWHDLGKYRPEFQERLRGAAQDVDHGVVGAMLALAKHKELGLPLAWAIAGHHGGLANKCADVEAGRLTPLMDRLRKNQTLLPSILPQIPAVIHDRSFPPLPPWLARTPASDKEALSRQGEFWVRFLFSALVDADFLDTEAFLRPNAQQARGRYDSIGALEQRLADHLAAFASAPDTPVNSVRREVLDACRRAADEAPGLFSLTVPTGGGKTLSGMAFALRHAIRHGLRRVIVAIPYTSIIEQTAQTYRRALGKANIIEHHSNLDPRKETEANRLASENWDAPVIVTTNVQFFESLFSNRPSSCRKLHNIARSVIVLDEAQTLPPPFLLAVLDALRELTEHYGCSAVLSTATQPALAKRDGFPAGLVGVREIMPNPADMARRLHRVRVSWQSGADGPPVAWSDLAAELVAHPQVLAIVHRRQDARELARLVPQQGRFHLSALMVPRHRSLVIARVKRALRAGRDCRLVSTQLIEAGVDIDFPAVYRALGGMDSIAQAAGRCNREGRHAQGEVVVFRAPTLPPRGLPARGMEATETLLRQHGVTVDPMDPCISEAYFRNLYFRLETDARNIQRERQQFNFETVARLFRLIDDAFHFPLVIPCDRAKRVLKEVRRNGPSRERLRALQPYTVSVTERDLARLEAAGAVETVADSVRTLVEGFEHLYSPGFGLVVEDPILPSPESRII